MKCKCPMCGGKGEINYTPIRRNQKRGKKMTLKQIENEYMRNLEKAELDSIQTMMKLEAKK